MSNWKLLIPVLFAGLIAGCQPPAETPQGMTAEQGDAILAELRKIRETLEKMPAPAAPAQAQRAPAPPAIAKASIDGEPTMGDPDAPITLVEFSDYQCPYCKRFFESAFPELKKNYVDTGKVKLVVRDLPLSFHQFARKAAQAVHCAGEQDKFWDMRAQLFSKAPALQEEKLVEYAGALELDTEAFKTCLGSDRFLEGIDDDVKAASAAGVSGTPSFIVAKSAEGEVEGKRVVGAQPYAVFEAEIKKLLEGGDAGA